MFWCLFFNLQAVLWRTKTVWLRQQVSIVLKPRLKGLNILLGIIQYFQSNIVGLFDHFCWTMFSASFICPTSTEHCLVDVRSCWTTLVSTLLCRQIKQHYWSVLVQTLIQCHWQLLLDCLNAPYNSKSPVFNLEVFVDLWWNAGHAVYWILAEIEREQWRKRSFLCKISPLHSPLWLFHFLSVSPLPKVSLWIYEDCQVHRLQHHWITIYKSHTTTCSFEHLNGIFCNQWVQTTRQVFFITNLNRQVSKQVFVLCDSSCQLCASVLIDNSREYKFS